jgi:hypothetical protein
VSLIATIALFTTTVAVARVQFDGFAPASQISCDGYVPLGVLALLLSFHQYLYQWAICYWCHISIGCGSLHSINLPITLCCWERIIIGSN